MWPNLQFPVDLVTFTEEILNVKIHFLCSVRYFQGPSYATCHSTVFFINPFSTKVPLLYPLKTLENLRFILCFQWVQKRNISWKRVNFDYIQNSSPEAYLVPCQKPMMKLFLKIVNGLATICDAFHDLVPFVQFKKREKHPWRSVTFSKAANKGVLLKVTLLHGCFSRFLNCTNGTKSRKTSIKKLYHRLLRDKNMSLSLLFLSSTLNI